MSHERARHRSKLRRDGEEDNATGRRNGETERGGSKRTSGEVECSCGRVTEGSGKGDGGERAEGGGRRREGKSAFDARDGCSGIKISDIFDRARQP
jgi:hypothetical protein